MDRIPNEHTIKNLQSNTELYKNKCTNYNYETKLNERENNNTSENTENNKNNLQTILEHNTHDYNKTDPKQTMIIKNNLLAKILSGQKPHANKIMIKSNE